MKNKKNNYPELTSVLCISALFYFWCESIYGLCSEGLMHLDKIPSEPFCDRKYGLPCPLGEAVLFQNLDLTRIFMHIIFCAVLPLQGSVAEWSAFWLNFMI